MRMRMMVVAIIFISFFGIISCNFFKPFGFFRESNAAMVCINAIQWDRYPQIQQKGIPITSYAFDAQADPKTQLYNSVITFGNGWLSVPYYFFHLLSLSPNEINIRIFSLCWFLFTLLILTLLSAELTKDSPHQKTIINLTLLFYAFNASILWYHVQGYVHETAVLPFYYLNWWLFIKYQQNGSKILLAIIALSLMVAVRLDWLPFIQAITMSVALWYSKTKRPVRADYLIPVFAVGISSFFIYFQFADWAGWPAVISHLKEKFLKRTIGGGGLSLISGLNYNFNILLFYVAGYGMLFLLFLLSFFNRKKQSTTVMLMMVSALMHHIIFWGFSSEHDHAVVKMAFPIAMAVAYFLSSTSISRIISYASIIVLTNISTYYYLHNYYTRKGMYTNPNFCSNTGTFVQNQFSGNDIIFINTEGKYLLQLEFYAKKPYVLTNSISEARKIMKTVYPLQNGYFIFTRNGIITKVEPLQ